MHRIIATSLTLVFVSSVLGGSVLAQSEILPSASPSAAPTPEATSDVAPTPEATSEITPASEVTLPFDEPSWHRIRPGRGPAAREDHTWTVDGEGRFAYLFGGRVGDTDLSDLWRFDLETDAWKKLSPKGKRPPARFGHSAVWVDGLGVVVFAGQRGSDFFDDLWVFDSDKGRWRELPAKGSVPKPRYGSCMVVGPDGRLWISHGFTDVGRFDDTRAYNLMTQRWASLTPDGRKPGERCLHDCFTSATGDLVLYGGQDDGAFALGDLWTMSSGHAWQRLDDPEAKPRRLYAVTEAGQFAYVFGGAGEDNAPFDDLWRVDRDTLEFQRVMVDGSGPAARHAGTLITDVRRGRLLLFGGQGEAARDDVWELLDQSDASAASASQSPAPTPAI